MAYENRSIEIEVTDWANGREIEITITDSVQKVETMVIDCSLPIQKSNEFLSIVRTCKTISIPEAEKLYFVMLNNK